jgi:hypothetical protein
MAHCLLRVDPWRSVCVRQRAEKDYGWWTSADMKTGYAAAGRARINDFSVRYLADDVVANPFIGASVPVAEHREAVHTEFFRQLMLVREVSSQPTTALQQVHIAISGKVGEDNKIVRGQNDDAAMTFMMATYFTAMMLERKIPYIDYDMIATR